MICFVVLHYMVKEETVKCVSNLQKLLGEKKIIIVDNSSPNGSGKELCDFYANIENVEVILNKNNDGFAKGNNLGYIYARSNYNPDFIVVINNDIQIEQVDFISAINKIYEKEKFAVLGPDVYVTTLKIHQNPKRLESYSFLEVQKLISLYEKKCKSKVINKLKCSLKNIKFLKSFVYNKRIENNSVDYKQIYYNVPLHGSCFVFSKLFIDKKETAFFEGTFMYYESEILDYECQRDKLKTMYTPEIKVLHNHNVSTNVTFKSSVKRTEFMNHCILDSLKAFSDLMIRDGYND